MTASRNQRLLAALVVNAALVVAEVVAGLAAHSTGLLADAGHNLTDVASIGLSLAAVRWAMRPRSEARSYGNHRGTILAALANATLLAVVTCAIVGIGIYRLVHPTHVEGGIVTGVAGAALVANGLAALFVHERSRDLNMRSVRIHLMGDGAAAFAVMAAGAAVLVAGPSADRADPAASLAVAALVLVEAVRILRESTDVLLESTPGDVDIRALRDAVTAVPGVDEVHDLHVWSLSSEYRALSAHLVLSGHPTLEQAQEVGGHVRDRLAGTFDIAHTTLELECERCDEAAPDPCRVDADDDRLRSRPTRAVTLPAGPAGSTPSVSRGSGRGAGTRRDPE